MSWLDDGTVTTAEDKIEVIKSRNKETAISVQNKVLEEYSLIQAKKAILEEDVADYDPVELKTFIQAIDADIQNPSEDAVYTPPLPPGVIIPNTPAIIATVTRGPGWNSILGWRLELDIADPEYVPASFAISLYSAADCTSYLYTLGAFQFDSETGKYFVVCSPGQEGGDVDYHFGLLYAAANVSCWTLPAGQQSKTIQII